MTQRRSLYVLVFALLIHAACSPPPPPPAQAPSAPPAPVETVAPEESVHPGTHEQEQGRPRLLLTGFEPFGGTDYNTSWEVIRKLDGEMLGGMKVKVLRLPVVWGKASERLGAAIREHKPDAVVCFGMGSRLCVERVARNERAR